MEIQLDMALIWKPKKKSIFDLLFIFFCHKEKKKKMLLRITFCSPCYWSFLPPSRRWVVFPSFFLMESIFYNTWSLTLVLRSIFPNMFSEGVCTVGYQYERSYNLFFTFITSVKLLMFSPNLYKIQNKYHALMNDVTITS